VIHPAADAGRQDPGTGRSSRDVKITETHLLSIDGDMAGERLALRRAYLTGRTVQTKLISQSRPVRVVDYSETYFDGRYEIAVAVAAATSGSPPAGQPR
jgi:hypothetical protein